MNVEPTPEALLAAYERLRLARHRGWAPTFTEAMQHPVQCRLLRARALQLMHDSEPKGQQHHPLRYQRPDAQWRTRWVVEADTQQLPIETS
ncbi:MAG: hypothetical protein V4739_04685 [Pseudomonadota bacterium]